MRFIAVVLALWLSLAGQSALASPAVLDEGAQVLTLAPHLGYRVDPDGRADAAAMFAQAGRGGFEPLPGGSSTFGFTEGAYWFHAEVFNANSREQRWLLVLHYPLLDNVDVYLRDRKSVV